MVTRRTMLRGMGGLATTPLVARVLGAEASAAPSTGPPIDRYALVTRHDVVRTVDDPELPVQVGNGGCAFGARTPGVQTLPPLAAKDRTEQGAGGEEGRTRGGPHH